MTDILRDGGQVALDLLKTQGLPALAATLGKLQQEAGEEWQHILLRLSTDLLAKHGPTGLNLLEGHVQQMLDGKPADLSGLSMREASTLLAALQRKEADTKNEITLYTKMIIEEIGKALAALVSLLFKEVRL